MKKKSRKLNKKKSRCGSRLKRVMRGGGGDGGDESDNNESYDLMKKRGHGGPFGSMSIKERTIYLNNDNKTISWYDKSEIKGSLDVSNLIKLEKTDTTLYIKSAAGDLTLIVDTDDRKNNLQKLHNDLLDIGIETESDLKKKVRRKSG